MQVLPAVSPCQDQISILQGSLWSGPAPGESSDGAHPDGNIYRVK